MIREKTHFAEDVLANLATVCTMMVDMQHKQNLIVNTQWNEQGYPFMRAAWTEASEAMGYTTWEWWKNLDSNYQDVFREEGDIAEFHMELVDCLHFLLSAHLQKYLGNSSTEPPFAFFRASEALMYAFDDAAKKCTDDTWTVYFGNQSSDLGSPEQTLLRVEALTRVCLEGDVRQALELLVDVAEHTELGLVGLIGRYFAKATLNQHRWANGYMEKTYTKSWGDGKEDNYFLNRTVIEQLDGRPLGELLFMLSTGMWQEELATELNEMYSRVLRTGHADHEACSPAAIPQ